MFKYQVGDTVVIVDYEDAPRKNDFPNFTPYMVKYCGREVTIRDMIIDCGEKILSFYEIGYAWREDWVIPSFKIDIDKFEKFLMEDSNV